MVSDTSATLERHRASKGCAEPVFRKAYERRSLSPQPRYRFDTSVPKRLRWLPPKRELFFFLIKEEPATMPVDETFSPFTNADIRTLLFSADVLKKCALIALHLIAEERRNGEGCRAPGLGHEWEMGCPKSPMWESGDEAWSEDGSSSSSGCREGNVGNGALHVIGLYWPGDKISVFLKDWELAKVTLSCHMALDMLCQEIA